MGVVHDALSAEVPEVETDGFALGGELELLDVDAGGFEFAIVEGFAEKTFEQRSFANITFTNEQDFEFVEGTFLN